ncbi:Ig domain-containing protein, partial [Brucella pituitosa]|uniref:Ig domain-containing protein n=1 Tax=Brucella pituitosa TaxID=571256 RepID=UPI0018E1F8B7
MFILTTLSVSLFIPAAHAQQVVDAGTLQAKVGQPIDELLGCAANTAYCQLYQSNLPEGVNAYREDGTNSNGPFSSMRVRGTPTQSGSFSLVYGIASDFLPRFRKTIEVAPAATITISPSSVSNGQVGSAYNQKLTASGGVAPYTFISGDTSKFPPGVSLSSSGVLSGSPTATGTYKFWVGAHDANGDGAHSSDGSSQTNGWREYSVTIEARTITVGPSNIPDTRVGDTYDLQFTASGGVGSYTYSRKSGSLPNGLSLSSSGRLTGRATVTGDFKFVVEAKDSSGNTGTRNSQIVVSPAPVNISISPSIPDTRVGKSYSQQLSASGGSSPYSYSISSGSLPAGISLSSSGLLSGAATTAGKFDFTIKATDRNNDTGTKSTYIKVEAKATVTINPTTLPNGKVGKAYDAQTLNASGGATPYTYKEYDKAKQPAGLTLNSSTGVFSGTPTKAGTYKFWLGATDKNGDGGESAGTNGWREYSVTIAEAPTIKIGPQNIPDTKVGKSYDLQFAAEGGTGPYTYKVITGTLPTGLTLSTDGKLTGTTTEAKTFNFTVEAKDAEGYLGTRSSTIVVAAIATVTINPATLPDGKVDKAYGGYLSATGGVDPYVYKAFDAGKLPPGVQINRDTGVLYGTPTKAGTYKFWLGATDKNGDGGESTGTNGWREYSVTIDEAPTLGLELSLPNGKQDLDYGAHKLVATGSTGFTYAVTGLPDGLTLAGDTISGTPSVAKTFKVTVTATDKDGYVIEKSQDIVIAAKPTLALDFTALVDGKQDLDYGSHAVKASGGKEAYSFAITGLPAGLTAATDGTI